MITVVCVAVGSFTSIIGEVPTYGARNTDLREHKVNHLLTSRPGLDRTCLVNELPNLKPRAAAVAVLYRYSLITKDMEENDIARSKTTKTGASQRSSHVSWQIKIMYPYFKRIMDCS